MRKEITVATRLAIVCNPNNPTSTALPLDEIAAFVADVPRHVCVILDEAYIEFNILQDPDESVALLDKHPNLVILRTFSKVYGLCGLRVGYGLCGSEEFRTAVDQVRQPFFCNAAAQAAALEALNHQDEVTRRVERNLAERIGLEDGLRELGLDPAESQANFVWFDLGDGREEAEVMQGLAQRGVLVRAGGALGREGALRVTVGTQAENERFLEALARAALMELATRPPHPALAPHIRSLAGWHERADGPVAPRRAARRPDRARHLLRADARRRTAAATARSWPACTTHRR